MKTAAYQGEPGAYSEFASVKFFEEINSKSSAKNSKYKLLPSRSFEDVFENVKTGEAGFGVLPIENSLYGSIFETYDLLLKYDFKIIHEIYLQINHYLLANKKSKFEKITKIFSHPQALGQCSNFLNLLKGIQIIPDYDTAGAAKNISANEKLDEAAIASKFAAEKYNLRIIKKNIQNDKKNFTRFIVISAEKYEFQNSNLSNSGNLKFKTSLGFELKSAPGSLFKALSVFALREINLTKIESRPIAGKPFQYNFYIDIEGNIENRKIQNSVSHLREISEKVTLLGSYQSGKIYKT